MLSRLRRLPAVIFILVLLIGSPVTLSAQIGSCVDNCDAAYYAYLDGCGGYTAYCYGAAWAQWLLCVDRCSGAPIIP